MVVRISDKTQNYSKVTKLLVKPLFNYRKRPYCTKLEEMYNDNYSIWQYSPKYYYVEDELTLLGIKDMLEGFLSKKSRNKEVNKPFIPILEMEYKKLKKEIKKV